MKNVARGLLQAHVAKAMAQFHVTAKSSSETKEKAIEAARKALGDKEPARARQITNWLLRHPEYKLADLTARLKAQGASTTARKASKTRKASTKKRAPASVDHAAAA